jgi:8-oxo-dGTP pyrophosphatase MutT (NUDIX family)
MTKDLSKNWSRENSSPLVKSTLFSIRKDGMLNRATQASFDVTIMESLDSVNVIAITTDQKIVFAEQYRFGIAETTIELPGGMLDDKEDPLTAGVRELAEETGYTGKEATYLGKTAAHPVFMNAYIHHILVLDAEQTTSTEFDDGELINVQLIDVSKIGDLLRSGYFNHPHTIAAISRLDLNHFGA